MTKRSNAPARVLAVAALIGGFVVVIVVLSAALGDGDSGNGGDSGRSTTTDRAPVQRSAGKKTPRVYVVKNGDTLTAIARQTGVSVARIERLNPEVDPLILSSGEKLKLR